MNEDKKGLDDGIVERPQLVSVVQEGDHPRICLRHNEVVNVEENRQFIHGEVLTNRPIQKLSVHQSVLRDVAFAIFAEQICGSVDVRNGATSRRGTPDEHVWRGQVIEKTIGVVLRKTSYCDVQDDSKLVVSLLKGVLPDVIFEKLFQNFDIQSGPLSSGPPELLE